MPPINVKAVLDSSGFMQGMDRMEGKVSGFQKSLKGIKATMSTVFAAGFFANLIKEAVQTADEIDNIAKQSGLGVESFQALRASAEEAGVSFETMRPTINALRRAMDKAKEGSEQQVEAFRKVGVSMHDLERMSTEQAMVAVGKAMNEAGDNSEALVASTVLLGAESTRLSEIYKDLGAVGIEGLIEKYKALGMVMDEQTIRSLDRQEEAASRLGKRLKTLGVQSTGAFSMGAEAIGALVGRMSAGESITEAWSNHIASLRDEVEGLADAAAKASEELEADPMELTGEEKEKMKQQEALVALLAKREFQKKSTAEKLEELERRRAGIEDTLSRISEDNYKSRLKYSKMLFETEDQILKLQKQQVDEKRKAEEMFPLDEVSLPDAEGGVGQAVGRQMSGDALARIGAVGGNVANTQENLTKRQIRILEKSQRTLERIENKEFGAIL